MKSLLFSAVLDPTGRILGLAKNASDNEYDELFGLDLLLVKLETSEIFD
jgi:hypothetical protein